MDLVAWDLNVPLGAAHAATIENPPVSSKKLLPTQIYRCLLAPHLYEAQVQCQVNGRMYADSSSHWTLMQGGKYDCTVRFVSPTILSVFVKKIRAVAMKYGRISHLLALAGTLHRGRSMISAYTSKKDLLRTDSTKKAGHTENNATIRTRHNGIRSRRCAVTD